jgi:predicted transcriptional regulator
MKNPTENKLEKLVFGMFDQMIVGADKYVTKQGSTWLIFTEDKRWVIEFTNDKTLWFNYNVFQSELDLIGKDCTEERDLIKRWFESRFLNKPKVWATFNHAIDSNQAVEDTIQNGVKNTEFTIISRGRSVDETIENGVKTTEWYSGNSYGEVEDTIQNGVKNTSFYYDGYNQYVEDTIQNGVKEILEERTEETWFVDDVIETGVKEIKSDEGYLPHFGQQYKAKQTIKNGVKEAKEDKLLRTVHVMNTIINGVKETKEMKHNRNRYHGHFILEDDIPTYIPMVQVQDVIENGVKHIEDGDWLDQDERIDDIIENGVKELKELPDKSGEFRGYGDYYHRQEDITKPHTEYVKEVIEDSYNHMGRVEGVIRNTDKDGI